MESHGDVFQLFQPGDVGFYQSDLFGSGLSQIVHFAYLQNEVFPRFLVRKTVYLIHDFCNGYGGIKRLIVKRHLQLQTCVGVVAQGPGYVIRVSVGGAVGNGYGRVYIIIIVGEPVDLR